MGEDKVVERIGLATSTDGVRFERAAPDGLLLAPDPRVAWRDLRVCNPSVLAVDGRTELFYQGISRTSNVSIGRATSSGVAEFACEAEPTLPWARMHGVVGRQDATQRT